MRPLPDHRQPQVSKAPLHADDCAPADRLTDNGIREKEADMAARPGIVQRTGTVAYADLAVLDTERAADFTGPTKRLTRCEDRRGG